MRKVASVALVMVGGLLLLPLLLVSLDNQIPLTPETFQPILSIPLARISSEPMEARATLPSPQVSGGKTRFIVVAAQSSAGDDQRLHCWKALSMKIEIEAAGRKTETRLADSGPYAWPSSCRPVGVEFDAPPESPVLLRASCESCNSHGGDLLLLTFWGWEAKDRLVGDMVREDLTRVGTVSAPIGLLLAAAGIALIRRKPARRQ